MPLTAWFGGVGGGGDCDVSLIRLKIELGSKFIVLRDFSFFRKATFHLDRSNDSLWLKYQT